MLVELVTAWTGDIDFQLLADGVPVNLTGMGLALILKAADGSQVNTSGKTSAFDAVNGKVRYVPAAGDLNDQSGPYSARWRVTDGSGKDVFFPNGPADSYLVRKP